MEICERRQDCEKHDDMEYDYCIEQKMEEDGTADEKGCTKQLKGYRKCTLDRGKCESESYDTPECKSEYDAFSECQYEQKDRGIAR